MKMKASIHLMLAVIFRILILSGIVEKIEEGWIVLCWFLFFLNIVLAIVCSIWGEGVFFSIKKKD